METELLEQRLREYEEEIGQRAFDDPVREKLIEQYSILVKCYVDSVKTETDRLGMYQQNDRLELEEEKIKAEAKRHKWDHVWDIFRDGVWILASLGSLGLAFNFENLKDSLLSRTAQVALSWVSKFKIRR